MKLITGTDSVRGLALAIALLVGCSSHIGPVTANDRSMLWTISPPGGAVMIASASSHITFTGSTITAQHQGAFSHFGGWILCPDQQPSHAKLFVEIDMDSIQTAIPLLTRHLKDPDFFDSAAFPRATFMSTAITDDTITGNLTLHGVTQTITCPAHWKFEAGKVAVDAKMTIHQSDFKMQSARTTNNDVPVEISLEAEKGAASSISPPLRGG